jgi:hypothetical protein
VTEVAVGDRVAVPWLGYAWRETTASAAGKPSASSRRTRAINRRRLRRVRRRVRAVRREGARRHRSSRRRPASPAGVTTPRW